MLLVVKILVLTLTSSLSFANVMVMEESKIQDYGVRGHVFPIIYESLVEVIMAKLKNANQNCKL